MRPTRAPQAFHRRPLGLRPPALPRCPRDANPECEEQRSRREALIRRFCAARLRDAAEGEEVAQAAFVRGLERIDRCGADRHFGAWIQTVALRLGPCTWASCRLARWESSPPSSHSW